MSKTAEDLQKELEEARAELEVLKRQQEIANEPRVAIGAQVRKSVGTDFRNMAKKKKLKLQEAMDEALADWIKKNQ
jgi:hypothetical protein